MPNIQPIPQPENEFPGYEYMQTAVNALRRNEARIGTSFTRNPYGTFTAELEPDEPAEYESNGIDSRCGQCGVPVTNANEAAHTWINDQLVCNNCLRRNYFTCQECEVVSNSYTAFNICADSGERQQVCSECSSRMLTDGAITSCRGCGAAGYRGGEFMAMENRCRDCVNNLREGNRIAFRTYRMDKRFIGTKAGDKVKSLRPFGIELECAWKSEGKAAKMSLEIPPYIGVGEDGSISGNGIEIKTPPANGKIAEDMIIGICKSLVKHGCTVDQSCGYHIHIDVSQIDKLDANGQLKAVKNLWLVYLAYEDVLLSFLPYSRRTNKRYAAALRSEYHVDEIAKARNMDELEALWYRINDKDKVTRAKAEHHHASRYRGINLHPMFSARHLEIRYHSGTLNVAKILEWAQLHLQIVDWALSASIDWNNYKDWANSIDLEQKTDLLFRIAKSSPESVGYFRARQETFKVKEKPNTGDHFTSGMAILEAEKEG